MDEIPTKVVDPLPPGMDKVMLSHGSVKPASRRFLLADLYAL